VIVTMNLRDLPPEALAPFGIEAQHPDEFCICWISRQASWLVRHRIIG